MTRTFGIGLVVAAVMICLIGVTLLGAGYVQGGLGLPGAILGFGLLAGVLILPLGLGGAFLMVRGGREAVEREESERLRRVLDLVKTRGQVKVSDLAIELGVGLPEIKTMVAKLVGLGVFSGYVNWDEGQLYSVEAAQIKELNVCKHCGGQVKLAGKGVIKCPYCGTEYYLGA